MLFSRKTSIDWHVFCFAVPLTRRNALAREHDHEFGLKRMTGTNPSSKTEYGKIIFRQETKEKNSLFAGENSSILY